MKTMQDTLEAQQVLLKAMWRNFQKPGLKKQQHLSMRENVAGLKEIVGKLFDRLLLWKNAAFFSLAGQEDEVQWDRDRVLRGQMPWLNDNDDDKAEKLADYGCAPPYASLVSKPGKFNVIMTCLYTLLRRAWFEVNEKLKLLGGASEPYCRRHRCVLFLP